MVLPTSLDSFQLFPFGPRSTLVSSLFRSHLHFLPGQPPCHTRPVRGFSWPGCFFRRSLRTSATNPAYCARFPSSIPRTDPASAPCRSWHYFPRHPVPVQWVLLSSYPPPGFPAPVHRYAPRLVSCLLALCRLGWSLCSFGLFPRPDSVPPLMVQLHPGTIPPAVPFTNPVFTVFSFTVVVVNLDPPAPFGLLLQWFGTRPALTTPRTNWTI